MTTTFPTDRLQSGVHERQRREALDEALVLEPAGAGLWRVCDGRVTTGPGRLLALIEEKAGSFEIMQWADEFVWSSFPTMRAALTHVVMTDAEVLAARGKGHLSWLS